MKNTIKMSLVAAIAVAGFSTTASAGNLEEMIKGVSLSGKMEVEYDHTVTDVKDGDKTTSNSWDLDWDMTAKVPVNDNITAVFGAEGDTAPEVHNDSITGKGNVQVTKVNFQYQNGPVTAIVGKQGMAGAPWFDDERANGVVAMYNAGPVVLAAAHFDNSNANVLSSNRAANWAAGAVDGIGAVGAGQTLDAQTSVTLEDADINAMAVIAPNIAGSGINASVWYASISGISADVVAGEDVSAAFGPGIVEDTVLTDAQIDADSYSIAMDGKFADMIGVDVRYTKTDYKARSVSNPTGAMTAPEADALKDALTEDASLLKIVVSADLGVATPYIGYGKTDKDQHAAGVDLTSDTDSAADFGGEILSIDELADAKAWILGVTAPVGNFTLGAHYITGDAYKGDLDYNEMMLQADYAMSKNFTIGAHFAKANTDMKDGADTDHTDAAISLEYKF